MAFRNFPAPNNAPHGVKGAKCPSSNCKGLLVPWDCGCSWGCRLCWVAYDCDKCHQKFQKAPTRPSYPASPPVKGIPRIPNPIMGKKPRQKCPYCGGMKVGLADHIRDKHGNQPRPQAAAVVKVHLECPDCGAPMVLKQGHFGLFYSCSNWGQTGCPGTHGAHPDGTPKGYPADAHTRKLRIAAHAALDPLWQEGPEQRFESRSRAYKWVQTVMNMSKEEAHIGKFNAGQCKKLIEHVWDCFGDEDYCP